MKGSFWRDCQAEVEEGVARQLRVYPVEEGLNALDITPLGLGEEDLFLWLMANGWPERKITARLFVAGKQKNSATFDIKTRQIAPQLTTGAATFSPRLKAELGNAAANFLRELRQEPHVLKTKLDGMRPALELARTEFADPVGAWLGRHFGPHIAEGIARRHAPQPQGGQTNE